MSTRFEFSFEGKPITAHEGQSVAAALLEAGERCLRIDEAGNAKGAVCAIGVCWECRCSIDGIPDTRACVTEARPGMIVCPSARSLPMRRSVVVVGAGPAGMAAAIEAAARGCEVTVLDESARPGGQIYRQADPRLPGTEFAEPTELARKKRLLRRFDEILHAIDYRANTIAYAAFGNGEIHVQVGDRTEVLKPDAVVLATGMRERAIPFPGWTLPGVMFAGGAQAILKAQRTSPGRIAVVAGCGPLPIVVASQLTRAGTKVAALASLRSPLAILRSPGGMWHGRDIMREGLRYGRSLLQASVPRLTGYVPIRALGKERLEAVQMARVDEQGHAVPGTVREIACDLLAVNYGFIANSELAAMAGARIRHDPDGGFWLPETDDGRSHVTALALRSGRHGRPSRRAGCRERGNDCRRSRGECCADSGDLGRAD